MANVNIGGLVSGIDTDVIIEGLMKIQKDQLDLITLRKTDAENKKTAFKSMQTQLLTLRTTATSLSASVNNPFDARVVNVSNPDSLVATASSRANVGTYQIRVQSLATAHTVASQSVSNPDSALTEGTFSIRVGSQQQADIVVDSSNNTLSGLADAINYANVGVNASVVQDGPSSYRLMLTSARTGAENQITVTNNLADSTGSAAKPVFDFDNPIEAAADAHVTLGSGSGAISVTSSTNTISSLIGGVTLNLQSADPAKTIAVTVTNDSEKGVTAVKDFVTAYNSFLDFVDQVTKYDAESNVGGVLQGEYSAISIRSQLQTVIQSIIPGGPAKANRLSALGISTSDTGRLTVNETQLRNLIDGNVTGVNSGDLKRLFAVDGRTSTGAISFVFATGKTQATSSPIEVNVTKAPERATLTASNGLPASTVIDSSNNSLKVNLDGVEATITLSEGTFTREQLAVNVQSAINSHSAFTGRSLSIGLDSSDRMVVTSDSYGATSRITLFASSAVSALGFQGGESDVGVDVAGEFIINGKVEVAKGSGRVLTGVAGNAITDGLQVRVNLGPSQVVSGSEGSLTISRGITSKMNSLIDQLLDGEKGILASLDARFSSQLDSIQGQIDRQQKMFDTQKEMLTSRFQAMERALQQLQSTSSMLGSQLAGVAGMSSK